MPRINSFPLLKDYIKSNNYQQAIFQIKLVVSLVIALSYLILGKTVAAQTTEKKQIVKSGISLSWHYYEEEIFIEMTAPTLGWITIGFNTTQNMAGAYLLMGRVKKGVPEVVEYYTSSPGNYQSIETHGLTPKVNNIDGDEAQHNTTIKFSLPIKSSNKIQKDLSSGQKYVLIMAYSQEDDFQHHSIMRTSTTIVL